MNSLIVENTDGSKIFNIIGRGVVLAIPYGLYGQEHNMGDVWNFTFPYGEKKVTVRGVERFSYSTSPVGLCFGGQLSEEDIRYMKNGKFNFYRDTKDETRRNLHLRGVQVSKGEGFSARVRHVLQSQ